MSEQREALAEVVAHADHCHGLVTRDGIEDACGKPPVAIIDGRGTEDEGYWPACAYHAHRYGRGNVVPLARLLADAEQRGRAEAQREAISVMGSLPNHNDLYHVHLDSLAAGRAEAWDEGAHAATQDYGIGVAENPYRAALTEGEDQ